MSSSKPKTKPKAFHHQIHNPKTHSDYVLRLIQIAVSQICQSVGFKSSNTSALQTLTKVAALYLKTLAEAAASYANASSRTQSNIFDIINALHDLCSIHGFPGAASTLRQNDTCLLSSSSLLKDLSSFVQSTDEIPFAKPIMPRSREMTSVGFPVEWESFPTLDLESRGVHIPKWLPAFPDECTFDNKSKEIECGNKNKKDGCGDLVLWENSESVGISGGGGDHGCKKRSDGGDLAMERGRVRFTLRMGSMIRRERSCVWQKNAQRIKR